MIVSLQAHLQRLIRATGPPDHRNRTHRIALEDLVEQDFAWRESWKYRIS